MLEQRLAHKEQLNKCLCCINKIHLFSFEGLLSPFGMGSKATETTAPSSVSPMDLEARLGRVMQRDVEFAGLGLNLHSATDLFGRPL